MSDFYILDDDHNLIATDVMTWGEWFGTADRHVALTEINGVKVSTVCLGLDHGYRFTGPPMLFETMVFRDAAGEECYRCSTWDDAVAQHARVVAELTADGEI